MTIFAAESKYNKAYMKHKNTVASILLNVLFCAALLWFFSRNAFLRPYLGSTAKECLSGLLLLAILYSNYYVFYPKLRQRYILLYWVAVAAASLAAGCAELAIGYSFIAKCNAQWISEEGLLHFFSPHLFLVFCRNLAFNTIPYVLREMKQLQQSLEFETKTVYQYAQLIDVCDKDNNCRHVSIDDLFYCKKKGNYTYVYTVDGGVFTRYCSIRYMEQHLGDKEFIRISPSIIVSIQYIDSCDEKTVVMRKMPWMETPLAFDLDTQHNHWTAAVIESHLHENQYDKKDWTLDIEQENEKKSIYVPSEEKQYAVLQYICKQPGCKSAEISAKIELSSRTVERCLFELKKQGLIQYTGSKKTGGYQVVSRQGEEKGEGEKVDRKE